ncbi:STAS domain-containing protein [Effusibacillus lacus]|uniref:STAS domain-containing protein n=1 Tax=Effusibacillus lacus TaxID=1348429 RepID=A0A292YSW6_9BACL|nr:STAS domain-containing protein [Effusibacillus lacus]TCS73494.1 stage II sporulation protein AA (anti-sigma F factor antagonist) [Effusibacillus lacus]GAX92009.1 hypothetical protein EFBL_3700 [Effusibacillus lacus]
MFLISTINQGDNLEIRFDGSLDISGVENFEKLLSEIDLSQIKSVVFNLEKLTFIDSTGIGCILKLSNILEEQNIVSSYTNVSDDIQEIFSIIGIEDLLNPIDS